MEILTLFSQIKAYGQSKLANVLHAAELAKKVKDDNVSVYSLHPGKNFLTPVKSFSKMAKISPQFRSDQH